MDISNNNLTQILYNLPVDKIIYINLDHRTDRKEQIEKQLAIFPKEKILRFPAISHEKGAIGCSKSHIAVIKMAIENNWNNCLIFEDDAILNKIEGVNTLVKLLENKWDIITLCISYPKYNRSTFRLEKGFTATAYMVNKLYYTKLLSNYEEGLNLLLDKYDVPHMLDQNWNKLMKVDLWYCVKPCIFIQSDGYSDIEKRHRVFISKFFE